MPSPPSGEGLTASGLPPKPRTLAAIWLRYRTKMLYQRLLAGIDCWTYRSTDSFRISLGRISASSLTGIVTWKAPSELLKLLFFHLAKPDISAGSYCYERCPLTPNEAFRRWQSCESNWRHSPWGWRRRWSRLSPARKLCQRRNIP